MPVIHQLCERNNTNEIDLSLLDPCFFSTDDFAQELPADIQVKALNHLAHKIQRIPKDLVLHMQRLRLFYKSDNAEGLYGALVDLFIALGSCGQPLRMRMLLGASKKLTTDQRNTLKSALATGITTSDSIPFTHYSRLSNPVSSSKKIIESIPDKPKFQPTDIMDEVRDLLDCGQIENAKKILEKVLLETPEQEGFSLELLTIYQYTRDTESFDNMRRALKGLPLAAQDAWDEQAIVFAI